MKLKELRREIGLTQIQMAKAFGVSIARYRRWEKSPHPPGVAVEMAKLMLDCIGRLHEEGDIKEQIELFKQGNLSELVSMFFF